MKINWLLVIILIVALFVRVYRTDQLLGFYYDQGRDGLVIWDLWHQGKFFLIGPTTGVEGIFLGPFYYYLIAPAYLLGGGNPVWPAVWVALLNVAAIGLLYHLGRTYYDEATGLVAAAVTTISYQLVIAARWLANPAPLPLFALLAIWNLLALVSGRGKSRHWLALGLSLGLSLQIEAASAVFFLPATALVLVWRWREVAWRGWGWGAAVFGLTLLPQIGFDLRHQHILFASFQRFLVSEKSWQPQLAQRLPFYWGAMTNKFFPDLTKAVWVPVLFAAAAVTAIRRLPHLATTVLVIWWVMPMVLLLFYHGNYGYIWDYYFTGVYPALVLLVAAVVVAVWRLGKWLKLALLAIGLVFFQQNLSLLKSTLIAGTDGPTHVSLGPSLAAVDWVYQDSQGRDFNVDVYVPPVIPHAYDYLFLWRGETKYQRQPSTERVNLLYTLYEVDPPHPERLQAWLDRQAGIGQVEQEARLGGVTVQRRQRL